jgi:amino acid adenylation domain-containing protein
VTLHERIAALSPEKRALLERRLQHGAAPAAAAPSAPAPAATNAPRPLSFAQQRLWLIEQIEPGHSFYHLPVAMRLTGPISTPVLERALDEVVSRHETLRTTFVSLDGQPMQQIAAELHVVLDQVDLRDTPRVGREAEAAAVMSQETQRPFDLARGPLLRAMLLRLDDHDHTLLLTMHHIVSDGWSLGILQREIAACYDAFLAGRPSPLPPLPIQYADFAVSQRERLRGRALEDLLSYWKQQLDGMPPLLELPADRPRPRVQRFRGASLVVPIPAQTVQALAALARRNGATLFMALLAAFKILLARYSGRTDIVVGSPIANRTRRELEGLVGFFVNTLVLRTDLDGVATFVDVLARVRDVSLGAFAHQELPFDKLVEELQPARDLSHNPLFQIAFGLQNADSGLTAAGGGRPSYIGGGTSKFDLTLSAAETARGVDATFEYNTELFDERTIVTLAQHYRTLLERTAARPDHPLPELLLPDAEERRRLIEAAAGPRTGAPSTTSIAEWCARHAQERPDRTAVEYAGQCLTWRELNARANRLAHALRARGVTRGSFVAVCLDRSLDLPVVLLGILRAGAAFVPLDPAQPAARLGFILRDAGARLLITQQCLAARFGEYDGDVLLLGAEDSSSDLPPDAGVAPDDVAYIIYTSGSTGQPKGVLVEHHGVANVADAQRALFGLEPESRVLQFSSLSFDASVFELAMVLGCGGTLVLASKDSLMPGPPLLETLRSQRINALVIPPSSLSMLPAAVLPDLTTLIAAGEQLPPDLVARWSPGRRFFNAYGPTEITIWATLAECRDADGPATIGRPIPNTQAYILDENLEPVPRGVPGEIVIGGAGVARGYHNRPELTMQRYVPDPFDSTPGRRLYRTGDRGRLLPGGDIQFLGRLDQQLKFRGYRIEPGEIEAVLLGHPALREAVVVPHRTPGGELRIVAHCVSCEEGGIDAAALRAHVRATLPDYMVPSSFRFIEAMPLTASGKADRIALARVPIDGESDGRGTPARSAEETRLADIWREVLERPDVGIHDSFFDLGGHSLLATRAMSRINDEFDLALPLRMMFDKPTIAEFAEGMGRAEHSP